MSQKNGNTSKEDAQKMLDGALNQMAQISPERDKSNKRRDELERQIYEAVRRSEEITQDHFTLYEINDALIRVLYAYNNRFLLSQFDEGVELTTHKRKDG